MREGARLVRFATAQWDPGLGGIDVHFVNVDSARVIERGFEIGANGLVSARVGAATLSAQVPVGDQSSLKRAAGQLGALLVLRQVADSELREQGAHVRLHAGDGQVERRRDLRVRRGHGRVDALGRERRAERHEHSPFGLGEVTGASLGRPASIRSAA